MAAGESMSGNLRSRGRKTARIHRSGAWCRARWRARRSAEAGKDCLDLENFASIVLEMFLPEPQTANPGRGGRRGAQAQI